MAQLVEWSLPTPEIRGSNPEISQIYLLFVHLNRKYKNKNKMAWNSLEWPIYKNLLNIFYFLSQDGCCDAARRPALFDIPLSILILKFNNNWLLVLLAWVQIVMVDIRGK